MPFIVQKFGGTQRRRQPKDSGRGPQGDSRPAARAIGWWWSSARWARTPILLIDLAHEISDRPSAREMDMLLSTGEQVSVALMAMAIHSLGHKAISLTGAQIGIKTDSTPHQGPHPFDLDRPAAPGAGRRQDRHRRRVSGHRRRLQHHHARAAAAATRRPWPWPPCWGPTLAKSTPTSTAFTRPIRGCCPRPGCVKRISYDEMLELASLGAGVMHSRSIEFAKKFNVPIHVRSSFPTCRGTMIVGRARSRPIGRCAAWRWCENEARVTLEGVPDRPGVSLAMFSKIADRKITVDMIVQNVGAEGKADISFTVDRDELRRRARGRAGSRRRSWAPTASATTTRWPRSRSSGWAWHGKSAWPRRCSAPWPTRA